MLRPDADTFQAINEQNNNQNKTTIKQRSRKNDYEEVPCSIWLIISFEELFQCQGNDFQKMSKFLERVALLLQQNQVIEQQSLEQVPMIFQMDSLHI